MAPITQDEPKCLSDRCLESLAPRCCPHIENRVLWPLDIPLHISAAFGSLSQSLGLTSKSYQILAPRMPTASPACPQAYMGLSSFHRGPLFCSWAWLRCGVCLNRAPGSPCARLRSQLTSGLQVALGPGPCTLELPAEASSVLSPTRDPVMSRWQRCRRPFCPDLGAVERWPKRYHPGGRFPGPLAYQGLGCVRTGGALGPGRVFEQSQRLGWAPEGNRALGPVPGDGMSARLVFLLPNREPPCPFACPTPFQGKRRPIHTRCSCQGSPEAPALHTSPFSAVGMGRGPSSPYSRLSIRTAPHPSHLTLPHAAPSPALPSLFSTPVPFGPTFKAMSHALPEALRQPPLGPSVPAPLGTRDWKPLLIVGLRIASG